MSGQPRPFAIPVPLCAHDFTLLNRIITTVCKIGGLNGSDRLVLVSVLQHIPNTDAGRTTSIDRILALSPANLKLLAGLFTSGLLSTRGWGIFPVQEVPIGQDGTQLTSNSNHQPGSDRGIPNYHWASVLYKDLFDSLKIPLFPPTRGSGGMGSAAEDLPIALTANYPQPSSPFIASVNSDEITFWLFLMVYLGPTLFNDLTQLIREYNSNGFMNGLFLDTAMNWRFQKHPVNLVPSIATKHNQRHVPHQSPAVPTTSPIRVEHQASVSPGIQYLQIPHSSIYRLFANIAAKSSLSHPLLMSLHLMLQRMIYLSGLSLPLAPTQKRNATDDASYVASQRGPRKQPNTGFASGLVGNLETRRKTPTVKVEANGDCSVGSLGLGVYPLQAPTVEVQHHISQQPVTVGRAEKGNTSTIDNTTKLEEGEVVEGITSLDDNTTELEEGEVEEGITSDNDNIPDFEQEDDEVRLVGMDPPSLSEAIQHTYHQFMARRAGIP